MAAPYKKKKKIRKRKHRRCGKERKRVLRNQGTTPSLDTILGPVPNA